MTGVSPIKVSQHDLENCRTQFTIIRCDPLVFMITLLDVTSAVVGMDWIGGYPGFWSDRGETQIAGGPRNFLMC